MTGCSSQWILSPTWTTITVRAVQRTLDSPRFVKRPQGGDPAGADRF